MPRRLIEDMGPSKVKFMKVDMGSSAAPGEQVKLILSFAAFIGCSQGKMSLVATPAVLKQLMLKFAHNDLNC